MLECQSWFIMVVNLIFKFWTKFYDFNCSKMNDEIIFSGKRVFEGNKLGIRSQMQSWTRRSSCLQPRGNWGLYSQVQGQRLSWADCGVGGNCRWRTREEAWIFLHGTASGFHYGIFGKGSSHFIFSFEYEIYFVGKAHFVKKITKFLFVFVQQYEPQAESTSGKRKSSSPEPTTVKLYSVTVLEVHMQTLLSVKIVLVEFNIILLSDQQTSADQQGYRFGTWRCSWGA